MYREPEEEHELLTLFVGVAIFTLNTMIRSAVVALLWVWFLVPMGLPALPFANTVGIVLMVKVIGADWTKPMGSTMVEYISRHVVVPAIVVGFGWVFYMWIVSR